MNARGFRPSLPSNPDQIEGLVDWWELEADGETTRGASPLLLTLQSSEAGAQAFYEQWVNAFVQSRCKQVPPPVVPSPPSAFGLFNEAEQSARSARVRFFEAHYPSWVSAVARKAAVWGNVQMMQDAVMVSEKLRPTPSTFDPLRLHLACLWTSHYLWLMSDMHGTSYFKYGVGITVTEAAYEKARRELRLVWNRTQRVASVSVSGTIRF